MSQLAPINLQQVIDDLQVVVDATMLLGGQVLDFSDPFKDLPPESKQHFADMAEQWNNYPPEVKERSMSILGEGECYTPQGYLRSQCEDAWGRLKTSLRRLHTTLEAGNIDMLDCPAGVRDHLGRIWMRLVEYDGAVKPEFTGTPDPLWELTAKMGIGFLLSHSLADLKRLVDCTKPDDGKKTTPQYLGECRIKLPNGEIIKVEAQEGMVLETLIEKGALGKSDLCQRSGVSDAVDVLKRLRSKFPLLNDYIILPGGKGKGGYRTTIKDVR